MFRKSTLEKIMALAPAAVSQRIRSEAEVAALCAVCEAYDKINQALKDGFQGQEAGPSHAIRVPDALYFFCLGATNNAETEFERHPGELEDVFGCPEEVINASFSFLVDKGVFVPCGKNRYRLITPRTQSVQPPMEPAKAIGFQAAQFA